MFATGETVGLAEWIIDDTCLVKNVIININCYFCHLSQEKSIG